MRTNTLSSEKTTRPLKSDQNGRGAKGCSRVPQVYEPRTKARWKVKTVIPQRHRASPTHLHRSCSPRRRHDSPGPRSRRSRSPERHHARHPCPMSASSSPEERHRASRSPRYRYASSTQEPFPPLASAYLAWWSAPTLRELRRWVKWAGGMGRREGRHSFHTFEKILTRTPVDPDDPAPLAVIPQRAWEALLRDAIQGLRRPYTPETIRRWLQDPRPQGMGHRRPTDLATTPPPAHRKGRGQREGPRQGGEERPKVTGRRPQEQGTGGNTTRGQGTTRGPPKLGKGEARVHGTEGKGATTGTRTRTTKEGRTTPQRPAPPHPPQPSGHRETPEGHGHTEAQGGPPEAHTRQDAPPQRRPDTARNTPGRAHRPPVPSHGEGGRPTQGEGDTPTKGTAKSTAQPTTEP